MSELDVIKAVLPRMRGDLAPAQERFGCSIYTNRSGPKSLEADEAKRRGEGLPPLALYFLLSPGPTPSSQNPFDSVAQFYLDGWGTWEQLDAAFARLWWLEGHQVGRQGTAARIRYGKVGGTRPKEPEAKTPDGREMYHYTDTYRAAYVELSRFAGPAVASPSPQARAP